MKPIKVIVNGLPGNMANKAAEHILDDSSCVLLPHAMTGPDITEAETSVGSVRVALATPDKRQALIDTVKEQQGNFICVDYTHPSAVNDNASFYCENGIPFVMGTTGGDRQALNEAVEASGTAAVIAPNMAKQIVAFQAMMEYAAETFPGVFDGYSLNIQESHQKGKADTSGTAKAMVKYFNKMGLPFAEDDITQERDPLSQKEKWKIPEEYLTGHAWHTYTITSPDKTAEFKFSHNINGRDIYAKGTMDGIFYLNKKISEGARGKIFSMIDVLKG